MKNFVFYVRAYPFLDVWIKKIVCDDNGSWNFLKSHHGLSSLTCFLLCAVNGVLWVTKLYFFNIFCGLISERTKKNNNQNRTQNTMRKSKVRTHSHSHTAISAIQYFMSLLFSNNSFLLLLLCYMCVWCTEKSILFLLFWSQIRFIKETVFVWWLRWRRG